MNKLIKITATILLGLLLVACGNTSDEIITIGSKGADAEIWQFAAESQTAKDLGLNIEVTEITGGPQLNQATAEGTVDVNAFQNFAYLDQYNTENDGAQLAAIATTYIEPMGIYSLNYNFLEEVPDGATVSIANSPSDGSRGLVLLESAGLISLADDAGPIFTTEDIAENPKNLEITEIDENTGPVVLQDVDLGLISNTIALEGGLNVLDDSLFYEEVDQTTTEHINILATSLEQVDNEEFQKLAELYHSKEVEDYVAEQFEGTKVAVSSFE